MLSPLVERELRIALLRRNARRQWQDATLVAGGICLVFLVLLSITNSRSLGWTLFRWLLAVGCFGIVTRGFALTADLFSEERRNGTLGLLVLTGLRPMEIFANKLFGATMLAVYSMLGALPFFAVPFLAGGISTTQFFCALAFFANGLLFCIAIGLLASVMNRDGGQAQATAMAITVVLCLATPIAHWLRASLAGGVTVTNAWLALSPGVAPALLFGKFTRATPALFWRSSAFTLCYSLGALVLAAVILHWTWRDRVEPSHINGWRKLLARWTRGNSRLQRHLRRRYLSRLPFCWLASRDRLPVAYAKLFLATVIVLWAGAGFLFGSRWLRPTNAFLTIAVVHLGLNWIVAYAASRRLAEERQSGGFEVLLTTPLSCGAIVQGQIHALIVQFRGVLTFVVLMDLVFFLSALFPLSMEPLTVVVGCLFWAMVVAYWIAVHLDTASLSMWIAAWTGRAGYAAIQAVRSNLGFVLWMGLCLTGAVGFGGAGRQSWVIIMLIMVPVALSTLARRRKLREKLSHELRLIAVAPVPARNDKRFKSWNPEEIYPPGRWGELLLRPAQTRKHRHPARATPGPLPRG